MWRNAVAFSARGEGALAIALSNILRKSENSDIGQKSAELIRFFSARGFDAATTLKDVWHRPVGRNVAVFATAFAVPLALLALVLFQSTPTSSFASTKTEPSLDERFDQAFGPTSEVAASTAPAGSEEVPPVPELTCESPPANGEILLDQREAADAGHRLEIDNGTRGDAIIKVRDISAGTTLASFFVSRGSSASLGSIPDGEYTIQYAVGDKLGADCRTFINDGSASANEFPGPERLRTRYEEELAGVRIVRSRLGYTLYAVAGGNVQPTSLNMDDFNKP